MKYKIAICDDSDAERQYVLNMVHHWADGTGRTVHTETFSSAENFLFRYAEESDYDILLLDIEMGVMDGVSMAKLLRKDNDTVQIIFITGYSDYISEGYEVAALHYLMKPVKEEKLFSVLDRAAEKLAKNEKVLNLEISGEMVRVPIYQIRYADVYLAQLFIAPMVLQKVETLAPLGDMLGTIGIFSAILLVLNALLGYVDENIMYGRIDVRSAVISMINHKAYTTSYPNTRDPEVLRLHSEALRNCDSNDEASEHIWHTLTGLLINVIGFVIYLFLLVDVNLLLIGLVVATTIAGFFVSRYINEWGYRHKDELAKYDKELGYLVKKTESIKLAKDIRVFGLAPWLNSVYTSTRRMAEAFSVRRERVYAWTCVVDVVLQFARNGIAYFYLMHRTLTDGLAASEFLLYFTAFTGFSSWVTGILSEFATLHKESLGLSVIQEYIHLPEQFRFEGGIPIPKADSYELKLENVSFRYPGNKLSRTF